MLDNPNDFFFMENKILKKKKKKKKKIRPPAPTPEKQSRTTKQIFFLGLMNILIINIYLFCYVSEQKYYRRKDTNEIK